MGFRSYQAHRAARLFKRHEAKFMDALFALWDKDEDHAEHVRQHISELERLLQSDQRHFDQSRDHAWEAASPEEEVEPPLGRKLPEPSQQHPKCAATRPLGQPGWTDYLPPFNGELFDEGAFNERHPQPKGLGPGLNATPAFVRSQI